jgi:biotin carboxyl carrier protein
VYYDSWRLNKALKFKLTVDDKTHEVEVKQPISQTNPQTVTVSVDGKAYSAAVIERDETSGAMKLKVNEKEYKVALGDKSVTNGKLLNVKINEAPFQIKVDTLGGATASATEEKPTRAVADTRAEALTSKTAARAVGVGGKVIRPPMPGKVISVKVKEGDNVKAGDVVLILEAMKMANEIASPYTGKVREVRVSPGQSVGPEDPVISIE